MPSLACPSAPIEPRGFWLRESPEGCESCNEPDHEKLCATCKARLCLGCAKQCDGCLEWRCPSSCLFKFQDLELCLTCLRKEQRERFMESVETRMSASIMAHCWEDSEISIDRDTCKESGRSVLHIGAFPLQIDVFLKPENEAALLAALTEGQPQPVVALLESVPVEDSAVGA